MKRNIIFLILLLVIIGVVIIQSCVSTKVTDKSGSQLWSENCQRCHKTPPSSAFTNTQWEIINTHMRNRAMLTDVECKKILDFLKD